MAVPAPHTVWLVGAQPQATEHFKQALQTSLQVKPANASEGAAIKDGNLHDTAQAPQVYLRVACTPPHLISTPYPATPPTTLLLGLVAASTSEAQADTALRAALIDKAIAFSVLYGSHPQEQLQRALRVLRQKGLIATAVESQHPTRKIEPDQPTRHHHSGIEQLTSTANGLPPDYAHRTPPTWSCEACSDPECEYRLFSRLISNKPKP